MKKRLFAQYVDGVEDSRDISGVSRFISGGIGGITSQLGALLGFYGIQIDSHPNSVFCAAIYPVETLKVTNVLACSFGSN